ncbi:glycosyltransferase family 2 protein [Paraburkholderia silvatlantica]|uniref:glycosyltransferase family 2 protein n=1 Tax=Paraburkholderia silvatlantica TaxID=321895 RepID=UPI0037522850
MSLKTLHSPDSKLRQIGEVKARLLPLTFPETVLERLIEALPRKQIDAKLVPIDDVTVQDANTGLYKSTSGTPRFSLEINPAHPGAGWYYLEAALSRNNGSRNAYFRVKFSDSNQEDLIIPVPTNLRGTIREVIYLPHDIASIYWVPTEASGFFSQSPLLLHKVTATESYLRRIHRVIFDFWKFGTRLPDQTTFLGVATRPRNLRSAYEKTAKLRIRRHDSSDYSEFLARNEMLTVSDISKIRAGIGSLPFRPLISILMVVTSEEQAHFERTIHSIRSQLYEHWELCLTVLPKEAGALRATIDEYRMSDQRITVRWCAGADTHVTALNDALGRARGEFVAVVKQADVLHLHALYHVVIEHIRYPSADLIYSDEDHVNKREERFNPVFKPDWNFDLLLSQNFISNLAVYRRARVIELDGFREEFASAEELDMLLRFIGKTDTSNIRHIPRILYSRFGQSSDPSALCPDSENGDSAAAVQAISAATVNDKLRAAHEAGKRSLLALLAPSVAGVEDGPAPCLYRIKHRLPSAVPLVSIIIPTRDNVEVLRTCVVSVLEKTRYENFEILIVDNQSGKIETHRYFDEVRQNPRVRVVGYDKPFNYSAINNHAVNFARGEVLVLLNNDIEVIEPEWLTEMVSHALRPETGVVGAKLLYPDGIVQHAGVVLGIGGVAGHVQKYIAADAHGYCYRASLTQNLSAVTAACLAVRKSVYLEVGGLNEPNLAVAFNDIDLSLKVCEKGYRNVFTPYALLYHHESLSRGRDDDPVKQAIFLREFEYMKRIWGDKLARDPAYNVNLSLECENVVFGNSRIKSPHHGYPLKAHIGA